MNRGIKKIEKIERKEGRKEEHKEISTTKEWIGTLRKNERKKKNEKERKRIERKKKKGGRMSGNI